jgi:hypothetical protein
MKVEINVFENTPYADEPDFQQNYIRYKIGQAYDEIGDDSYAVPCTVDLYKALKNQEVAFTDEEIDFDYAFVGLLGEELNKKVSWLDNRKITVKLDGKVVAKMSMKEWFKSREWETEDEDGRISLVNPSPRFKDGYTHDELWDFLNSCVPQRKGKRYRFATLVWYKKGISMGLQSFEE